MAELADAADSKSRKIQPIVWCLGAPPQLIELFECGGCVEDAQLMHSERDVLTNIRLRTFYRDVSKPAAKGDEYIEVSTGQRIAGGFELRVHRGRLGGEKRELKREAFGTHEEMEAAANAHCKDALRQGFKPALSDFVR